MPVTGPDPAPVAPISRHTSSVARLLRAASLVLALLFVLRVLLSLGPLRSGPLEVLLRFCEAMVGQAPFAVLVVCLIGLSLLIDEECRPSRRLARALHAAALPLAFTYLLLIPLYGTAQWWRSRAEASSQRQGLQSSLQQLRSTRLAMQGASSSAQLKQIWASLPAGSPPLSRFGSDVRQQRRAMLGFLNQVSDILMARLEGVDRSLGLAVVRSTGLYALACLGLAALFHRCSRLDPPRQQRWQLPGGKATAREKKRRAGPLDHELHRRLQESGAIAYDAPVPDPGDPAADRMG